MRLYEFPRQARLLTAADFRKVFDHVDAKVSTNEITLLACRTELETKRIGFIIAKKQIKTAVQRNRIKRHFREQFRIFRQKNQQSENFDFVVLARKACQEMTNEELDKSIQSLLKRLTKRLNQPVVQKTA